MASSIRPLSDAFDSGSSGRAKPASPFTLTVSDTGASSSASFTSRFSAGASVSVGVFLSRNPDRRATRS